MKAVIPLLTRADCENIIEPKLTPARFYHSKCVADAAKELAALYGVDGQQAELAGILHDVMKDTPHKEQLKIIKRFGIMMNNTEKQVKKLYHAISGAAYVQFVLGVQDKTVIDAIRWHTSGRKGMTPLEKVVFVADFISADRDYPGVGLMRSLARVSLEAAMHEGITYTVKDLFELGEPVDSNTIETYNEIIQELK